MQLSRSFIQFYNLYKCFILGTQLMTYSMLGIGYSYQRIVVIIFTFGTILRHRGGEREKKSKLANTISIYQAFLVVSLSFSHFSYKTLPVWKSAVLRYCEPGISTKIQRRSILYYKD